MLYDLHYDVFICINFIYSNVKKSKPLSFYLTVLFNYSLNRHKGQKVIEYT